MRNWSQLLFVALLASCGGKDKSDPDDTDNPTDGDADTDADSDSDTDVEPCLSVVTELDPEPNSTTVALDAVVTASFDVAVPASGNYGITIAGAPGTTTLAADGLSMTFQPSGPFLSETTYTVEVEVCDDAQSADFTTLPGPVDTTDVEGNTYALDWATVTVTNPPNPGGTVVHNLIEIAYVVLQVRTIDPVSLEAPSVATIAGDDGAGNAVPDCTVAIQQVADFSLNPFFAFNGDLQIVIDPTTVPPTVADVEDFELLAQVSGDGTSITDVRLSGLVAPEQFLNNQDCNSAGVQILLMPTCEPCTISATGSCMKFEAEAPIALVQPALDLVTECGL